MYGVGDGSTTFNLPDCRGRVSAGKDNMGGSSANRLTAPATTGSIDGDILGQTGGEEAHTLLITEMPPHDHRITSIFMPSGTGSLQLNDRSADALLASDNAANTSNGEYWSGYKTVTSTGGGLGQNNIQPTIIFNKIIKY